MSVDTKALRDRQCTAQQGIPKRTQPTDQLTPKFDPKTETILFSSTQRASSMTQIGKWAPGDKLAPLTQPQTPASLTWFNHTHANGVFRARLQTGPMLDIVLLFRAKAPNPTQMAKIEDGYGVRLTKNTAQMVSIQNGLVKPLTEAQTIFKLKRRKSLEVIISTFGKEHFAQVHDGQTGVELLNLHATDSTHKRGQLGVYIPPNHLNDKQVGITQLSLRTACKNIPSTPKSVKKPPYRFVTLSHPNTPPKLSPTLTKHLQHLETQGNHHHYRTGPVGMEHLFCAQGVSPTKTTVEIPWKFLDRDYLFYKTRNIVEDKRGIRVDLSYKNPRMVEHLLKQFHKKYPKTTQLHLLGHSHQKRPIYALAIAKNIQPNDPRPTLLLNAAHHGDEPLSTEIAFDAIKTILKQQKRDRLIRKTLDNFVVWVIPQVNPDGALAFLEHTWRTGRKNGRDINGDGKRGALEGVDLNRNYPFMWGQLNDEGSSPDPDDSRYRGDRAASEPETQAMMKLVNAERFGASISYHSGTVCILAPYTIDGVKDQQPNEAWALGQYISKQMPTHPEGRTFKLRRNLYAVSGTDQDWFRHEHGTVGLLVEAVRTTPRDTCVRRVATQANRRSWLALFQRTIEGPTLIGTTTDAKNNPVEATITIKEQTLNANENWTTRPRDGVFMRYMTRPGKYTITASAKGYQPVTKSIHVRRGLTRMKWVLQKNEAQQ